MKHAEGPFAVDGNAIRDRFRNCIALVHDHEEGRGRKDWEAITANARLLAASSDMLETLQEIRSFLVWLRDYYDGPLSPNLEALDAKVLAVLEKAGGV